jgi:chromosome segregation ATPase
MQLANLSEPSQKLVDDLCRMLSAPKPHGNLYAVEWVLWALSQVAAQNGQMGVDLTALEDKLETTQAVVRGDLAALTTRQESTDSQLKNQADCLKDHLHRIQALEADKTELLDIIQGLEKGLEETRHEVANLRAMSQPIGAVGTVKVGGTD